MFFLENDTLNMNICTSMPKLMIETVEQYISILIAIASFQSTCITFYRNSQHDFLI